jgi:hypothetical protein
MVSPKGRKNVPRQATPSVAVFLLVSDDFNSAIKGRNVALDHQCDSVTHSDVTYGCDAFWRNEKEHVNFFVQRYIERSSRHAE